MFDIVKCMFCLNIYTVEEVKLFVKSGLVSTDQFKLITNEPYE